VHDQPVARVRSNQRTGKPAVVSPQLTWNARLDDNRCDLGPQIDFDNMRIGIDVHGLWQLDPAIPSGGLKRFACRGNVRTENDAESYKNRAHV
jgi:hypothetical protein